MHRTPSLSTRAKLRIASLLSRLTSSSDDLEAGGPQSPSPRSSPLSSAAPTSLWGGAAEVEQTSDPKPRQQSLRSALSLSLVAFLLLVLADTGWLIDESLISAPQPLTPRSLPPPLAEVPRLRDSEMPLQPALDSPAQQEALPG
jgi:hypothetical protein